MRSQRWLRRMSGFLQARVPEAELGRVTDPRSRRGRRWDLATVLETILVGLMSGVDSAAAAETFSENMGSGLAKALGLSRRLADTTLRDVLCRLCPQSMRYALHRVVRAALRRKGLPCVGLPFHVLAMDGKATALTSWDGPYAQRHMPENGKPYGLLRTVTSTLATAPGRPCIDVSPIPSRTNEMGHFKTALADVCETYPGLLRVVTYDGGANSEENARAVLSHGKDYLFHMPNEERHMTQMAADLLPDERAIVATTEDVLCKGRSPKGLPPRPVTIQRRTLRFMAVHDHSKAAHASFIWGHTRTILRVDSERILVHADGTHTVEASETRLYCSSLSQDALTPAQWLRLVRLHWCVELTHQTLDVAFREDDHPWFTSNAVGALAVMVLRRIAYTLMTLFRSVTLRSDENRSMPWKTLMDWVRMAVWLATPELLSGLRPRKAATATL